MIYAKSIDALQRLRLYTTKIKAYECLIDTGRYRVQYGGMGRHGRGRDLFAISVYHRHYTMNLDTVYKICVRKINRPKLFRVKISFSFYKRCLGYEFDKLVISEFFSIRMPIYLQNLTFCSALRSLEREREYGKTLYKSSNSTF